MPSPDDNEPSRSEEKILSLWRKNRIFEKTLEKKSPAGEFVFYDGPPFATGLPHYGHILAGIIKDAIPRYRTMRGFHVRRRWGWDCHGLPLENEVEKELNLAAKRDIEKYGIGKFNARAEESVLRYADDWRRIIPQTGRWVDMERDYRTMDWTYTESVWWVFKTLHDKGLIYEGFKSMHLCPRCETTLSNFEVSQGYKDATDVAVTVKLPLGGEEGVSLLAWTTTAWTLPGNMAVAVNGGVIYGKFEIKNQESGTNEYVIVAKERAAAVFKDKAYELVEEFRGDALVGRSYEPPFGYYKNAPLKNKHNAWKVYAADFVTLDEGTGVVHIAPAFGEDDLALAERHAVPIVHHVGTDGAFKKEVADFKGLAVKPKDNPQATDIEIIKNLAHRGLLFAKEKITHAYPFCWRCETPLINYAATSWFVAVSAFKDKLIAANKKIRWVPADIRDGRFGKWLEGARDWAISRSRFWGAPIPVWKCGNCGHIEVAGSLKDVRAQSVRSGNAYFVMRHGEAESNVKNILNAVPRRGNGLTEKGAKDVERAVKFLKRQSIDLIFVSPLPRAEETGRIIAHALGVKRDRIKTIDEIREINFGMFEGGDVREWKAQFRTPEERFTKRLADGESLDDVRRRMAKFLFETDQAYNGKNILIISHEDPLWMLAAGAGGYSWQQAMSLRGGREHFMRTGEVKKIDFTPLPHDDSFKLNFHRPYIDDVKFKCPCGGKMKRVPEVFDCWFESGSMPYGEHHYPFENTDVFNPPKGRGFPADFIAEGLDQTRGWFYSLLVLAVALFGESPYRNVIVNGLVLAEDGRKMSKRLKNYPDPVAVIQAHGADALRMYLLSSPAVRAEDLRFSEKNIGEMRSKIISRLQNVAAFYKLYAPAASGNDRAADAPKSNNILDLWVRVRLTEVVNKVTDAMERYELDQATRPIAAFIEDLSTWYLRRSRERFKSADPADRASAAETTRFVLTTLAKVIAPFAPFVADEVYHAALGEMESVHLESWPKYESRFPLWPNPLALLHRIFGTHRDIKILEDMEEVRRIVSLALEARARAGIKVRQPLGTLRIKNQRSKIKGNEDLLGLIRDEVNVKEIVFSDGAGEQEIDLDTEITPELKEEGMLRDVIRAVQDLRKKEGLIPSEPAVLFVKAGVPERHFIEKFENKIKDTATVSAIEFRDEVAGDEVAIGDFVFTVNLKP